MKYINTITTRKHAGKFSDIGDEETVVILDKLLEYKCMSEKEHKQILFKCNLIHK